MSKPELWRDAHVRTLTAALRYTAASWRVFPLHTPDALGCSCGRANCGSVGKHPRTAHGLKDARANAAIARVWWGDWPDANVGVVTGAASGILVLDVDADHGGMDSLDELVARYAGGVLPVTLTARTGGGGLHFVFAHPGGDNYLPNATRLDDLAGLDVRGDGGYIVAPPSLHMSGRRYEWLDPAADIAPLPAWLWRLVIRPRAPRPARPDTWTWPAGDVAEAGQHWLAYYLPQAAVGRRNEVGMLLAAQLRDAGLPREGAEEVLAEYADRVPGDGYSDAEARATVRSVYARAPREPARRLVTASNGASNGAGLAMMAREVATVTAPTPRPPRTNEGDEAPRRQYKRTELGNMERLIDRHGRNMAYTKALDWCAWTGTRWRSDSELMVQRWQKETVRAIYDEAAEVGQRAAASDDQEERTSLAKENEALSKWAVASETEHMRRVMVKLAMAECEIDPAKFDADPWRLNVANGTIDLRTGILHPHRRDDYLMHMAPVAYDPAASAPTFERFIRDIMLERDELVTYLQRVLGYAISGNVTEQEWYLLVGGGENGKGTLMELMRDLLGDYAGLLEPESLVVGAYTRDGGAPSPDIAALKGKRLVTVTETEDGARLAAARVKKLSGADTVTGRLLHRDPLTFMPSLKLFVYTNNRPQSRETTHAFWRRVRYIPFELDLKSHPERKDRDLPAKLRQEMPGILAWLVRGCLAWQRDGLAPPGEVIEATAAYRAEQDVMATFLDDCCALEAFATVTLPALYAAYERWCERSNERPMGKRGFNRAIAARDGVGQTRTGVARYWTGIGLTAVGEGGG